MNRYFKLSMVAVIAILMTAGDTMAQRGGRGGGGRGGGGGRPGGGSRPSMSRPSSRPSMCFICGLGYIAW